MNRPGPTRFWSMWLPALWPLGVTKMPRMPSVVGVMDRVHVLATMERMSVMGMMGVKDVIGAMGVIRIAGVMALLLGLLWPLLAGAASSARLPFALAEPAFERIDPELAIAGGTVTALLQDNRGLLWIGSQRGLVRYDGYRFQSFVHNPRRPGSLPGNFVVSLAQTQPSHPTQATSDAGKIWGRP